MFLYLIKRHALKMCGSGGLDTFLTLSLKVSDQLHPPIALPSEITNSSTVRNPRNSLDLVEKKTPFPFQKSNYCSSGKLNICSVLYKI
jgi:hypothetical protein